MTAIGNVDDHYITEAMEYKVKKKPIWLLKAAVAACLCIAILGGGLAFTAVAAERDYYKELVYSWGLVDQAENPSQTARSVYSYAHNQKELYVLTVTTDKTRYTVDDYIYVTARIENVADYSIDFDAPSDRYGVFYINRFLHDNIFVELYDATYNRHDITADSFEKDERQMITLSPGEYYSQTFRFSAKYISKEPDYKPSSADEILPLGTYYIDVQLNPNIGFARTIIPVEIVE